MKPLLVPANIEVGDITEIFCAIKRGNAPIEFKWLHNGKEIKSHTKYKITTSETSSHFLIGKMQALDIGNFTCIASNAFGMDSKTETVIVEGTFWSIYYFMKIVTLHLSIYFSYLVEISIKEIHEKIKSISTVYEILTLNKFLKDKQNHC